MRADRFAPRDAWFRSADAPHSQRGNSWIRTAIFALPGQRPVRRSGTPLEHEMETRNVSAAVIGAGDYIGAAIARKFAAEGFTVFAGRRHGERLAPVVAEVETAGGRIVGRSLDARKEEELAAFLRDADAMAPL